MYRPLAVPNMELCKQALAGLEEVDPHEAWLEMGFECFPTLEDAMQFGGAYVNKKKQNSTEDSI